MNPRSLVFGLLLAGCGEAAPANVEDSGVAAETGDDAAVEVAAEAAPEAAPGGCAGKISQPLDATWKITSSGVERSFNVHVPKSYDPSVPTPIVLDFHGLAGDAAQQAGLARMIPKSDAAGFIAVHANGTGAIKSWNGGACCGDAASKKTDDVAFVSAMLDELQSKLCVDVKRIFSTGISNGGFLSQRLACELSERIAAIAPVAGVMGIPTCTPKRPVSVIHFHGTSDSLVPYNGNPGISYPSVKDTIAGWVKRNGCTDTAKETYRKGEVHCETNSACTSGVAVTLCTVETGGHTWPGGTASGLLGKTTTDISATDAMWDFFTAHPM